MTRLAIPRPLRRAQRSIGDRLPNFRIHRSGILAFLGVMGPGLIAGLAGNDAGGIATYSALGAETGFRMLWILPVTTLMLVVVLEMAARMGAVTGQGLGDLIRDEFGIRWTLFAMIVLLIANGANIVAEFAGAAAALEIFGIPRYVTVPLVAAGIWALVVFAGYRLVDLQVLRHERLSAIAQQNTFRETSSPMDVAVPIESTLPRHKARQTRSNRPRTDHPLVNVSGKYRAAHFRAAYETRRDCNRLQLGPEPQKATKLAPC